MKRPRQMRPTEERMRDSNPSVARQAQQQHQAEAGRQRYGGAVGFPVGPGGVVTRPGSIRPSRTPAQDASQRAEATSFSENAVRGSQHRVRGPAVPGGPEQSMMPVGPGGVVSETPIAMAVRATGTPQHYLDRLIVQESGGDPNARAPTSSATGHAQFIDSTWLGMVKRYGGRYGAGDLAQRIVQTRGGGFRVDDANTRRQILDMRTDPAWAAIMAGHFARENESTLRAQLRRPIREGEVYLAHFLGAEQAAALLRAADQDRDTRGRRPATQFVTPQAAEANRSIFYEGRRARTANEVVTLQTRKFRPAIFRGGAEVTP